MFKYVIYYLGLKLPENAEPVAKYGFNVGMVSLTVLFCFINIFGYLISIFILKHYDLENKYPGLKTYFKTFENTSIIFIVIEAIIGFGSLFCMIFFGLYPLSL